MDKEWYSNSKISWYTSVLKWNLKEKLWYKLEKFIDLNIKNAQEHFNNEILWLLIDIDDCIAPAYLEILEENKEKIRELLEKWIKIWILSNWINLEERTRELTQIWVILCNTKKAKPDVYSFIEAAEIIWVNPKNTLMIWDDISKDWWALQNNGENSMLWFIPVNPIWNKLKNIPKWKKINYIAKVISRKIANWINWL